MNARKVVLILVVAAAAGLVAARASHVFDAPKAHAVAVAEPEDGHPVRGSMSLAEIAAKTGVPAEYVVRYLNLPSCVAGDTHKPAREWLTKHNYTIEDLREAVARYQAGHRL